MTGLTPPLRYYGISLAKILGTPPICANLVYCLLNARTPTSLTHSFVTSTATKSSGAGVGSTATSLLFRLRLLNMSNWMIQVLFGGISSLAEDNPIATTTNWPGNHSSNGELLWNSGNSQSNMYHSTLKKLRLIWNHLAYDVAAASLVRLNVWKITGSPGDSLCWYSNSWCSAHCNDKALQHNL